MNDKEFNELLESLKPQFISIDAYHPHPHGFYIDKMEKMVNTIKKDNMQKTSLPPVIVLEKRERRKHVYMSFPIVRERNVRVEYVAVTGCHRWFSYKSLGYNKIPAVIIDYDVFRGKMNSTQMNKVIHYVETNKEFLKSMDADFWRYSNATGEYIHDEILNEIYPEHPGLADITIQPVCNIKMATEIDSEEGAELFIGLAIRYNILKGNYVFTEETENGKFLVTDGKEYLRIFEKYPCP